MTNDTRPTQQPSARRDLFLASFTLLFFELACIRWFGSMVIFLTFFTNLVLLACFLGMSIGCLAARSKRDFARHTLTLALTAMVLGWATLIAYNQFQHLNIDIGGQQSPQQIFFGTEYRASDPSNVAIPIEVIAGFFFVLIALPFIGLGQRLGRALDAIPDRLSAYSIDIAGSLSGIIAFGLASYFQTPPLVWFGIATACILSLTRDSWQGTRRLFTLAAAALILVTAFLAGLPQENAATYWSPYYKINLQRDLQRQRNEITTNNISHQTMVSVADDGPAYCLPHLLQRDSGGKPFEDVLIIGAGSGNDVQGARLFNAKHIDGVEIDPVIRRLGQLYHPNHPYDDPRVSIHQDDGRSYLKRTTKKYDLIVYALVDSLVLHSSYTSLRLESYLFTQEAMNDIKARLKPGGMFAMYNYFRQGWVVARLKKMTTDTYGQEPLVISLPYRKDIEQTDAQRGSITFFLCGNTQNIRKTFAEKGQFWLNSAPEYNFPTNEFGPAPRGKDGKLLKIVSKPPKSKPRKSKPPKKGDEWLKIAPATVGATWPANEGKPPLDYLPHDNWPFLYLREALIPDLNLRGMALLGTLSLILLAVFAPWKEGLDDIVPNKAGYKFNGRMFFLGAGFMLLETKSVVHMALLFGSTWIVNSIVFAAVLVMILLANLFVHVVKPKRTAPYYALLIAALLIGIFVPMNVFLALPGSAKILTSCLVTFAPIFFAGIVFATSFRDSRQPGLDFGCNIAGVMLGGLCENFSLMLGFSNLLGVAIAFYVLSALLRPRAAENSPIAIAAPLPAEG